jgi:hypothetical protein
MAKLTETDKSLTLDEVAKVFVGPEVFCEVYGRTVNGL